MATIEEVRAYYEENSDATNDQLYARFNAFTPTQKANLRTMKCKALRGDERGAIHCAACGAKIKDIAVPGELVLNNTLRNWFLGYLCPDCERLPPEAFMAKFQLYRKVAGGMQLSMPETRRYSHTRNVFCKKCRYSPESQIFILPNGDRVAVCPRCKGENVIEKEGK
jgi:hypothetical protein